MRTSVKFSATAVAVAALSIGLTACGSDSGKAGSSPDDALVVGASPTPHADILKFVKDNLAAKAGLKLEIKEYTDYVTPNTALEDGDIGANYFQTAAYLKDFNAKNGTHIVGVENVHVEPMGLYSKKDTKASELKSGDTIAIPNDAVNEGRALQLLAANDIITLKDGAGSTATVSDIKDAKGLKFKEIEAAQTPAPWTTSPPRSSTATTLWKRSSSRRRTPWSWSRAPTTPTPTSSPSRRATRTTRA